jgi:hypothetical protein
VPKRNITLPPVHNQRAPEQWRIISERVDFEDKTVLDLGCGYKDILWRAWQDGARSVLGIEQNQSIRQINEKVEMARDVNFSAYFTDIDDYTAAGKRKKWQYDIAICFSVLPYLDNPTATLHWIHEHSTQALVECQLYGDGPGPEFLKSPMDMRQWLDSIGWKSIERIGETMIKGREAKRGIWLCQQ